MRSRGIARLRVVSCWKNECPTSWGGGNFKCEEGRDTDMRENH